MPSLSIRPLRVCRTRRAEVFEGADNGAVVLGSVTGALGQFQRARVGLSQRQIRACSGGGLATGIALARAYVDFTGFQQQNLEIEERRLMPYYVEAYFISSAKEVGLRIEPRAEPEAA